MTTGILRPKTAETVRAAGLASSRPPTILLGGGANAVSVARSLGRSGVPVYVLDDPGSLARHSRFCRRLDVAEDSEAWADYLLGPASNPLRGAVLLACCDAGIELLAARRGALSERYLLDDSNPVAQLQMLNKLETYRAAAAADVPTPRFWLYAPGSGGGLDAIAREAEFPLIVKPRLSHLFEALTGRKLLVVHQPEELAAAVAAVAETGTDSLVLELIPGSDDRLCSYYTYLDEQSRPMFRFTKRIIRRYPPLEGGASYHVTDDVPEAAELGERLFRHVGLRGLANVEFKRDVRDGRLKVIECNARFTAGNPLVARSGIDLAQFVYNRLTGGPLPATDRFTVGMRLWDPIRDFQSYRASRRAGGPSFPAWLASVCHRQSFPFFEWSDPMPALVRLTRPARRLLGAGRR